MLEEPLQRIARQADAEREPARLDDVALVLLVRRVHDKVEAWLGQAVWQQCRLFCLCCDMFCRLLGLWFYLLLLLLLLNGCVLLLLVLVRVVSERPVHDNNE